MTKPHLSASQLNMIGRCGEQYRRRYVEGEKIPAGVAAAKGTAVHGAADNNLKQKIVSHQDISVSDAKGVAAAKFEDSIEVYGITLTPDEKSTGKAKVLSQAKDRSVAMAGAHMELQAHNYQPLFSEETVRLEIPQSSHDFLGVIDCITDKGVVVDWKTSTAKKASQHDADQSVQLTAYALMYNQLTGSEDVPLAQGLPTELRLDYIIDKKATKTKPSSTDRHLLRTYRNEASIDALAARHQVATQLINAGVFAPVEPGHWICNPKWCGYWSTCPYVDSEREARAKV